jgi:hypothetical protein
MGRFSCSLAVFRRSWPGAYGIYVGSAAAALTCRGATCLLAHAPLTIPAIPTTCPRPSMTSRHEQDAALTDRARARPQFPTAMNAAAFQRLPAPVAEIWDWQLRGVCRGLDGNLFFHPDHERGPVRLPGRSAPNKCVEPARSCSSADATHCRCASPTGYGVGYRSPSATHCSEAATARCAWRRPGPRRDPAGCQTPGVARNNLSAPGLPGLNPAPRHPLHGARLPRMDSRLAVAGYQDSLLSLSMQENEEDRHDRNV